MSEGRDSVFLYFQLDSTANQGRKPRFLTKLVAIGGLFDWGSLLGPLFQAEWDSGKLSFDLGGWTVYVPFYRAGSGTSYGILRVSR